MLRNPSPFTGLGGCQRSAFSASGSVFSAARMGAKIGYKIWGTKALPKALSREARLGMRSVMVRDGSQMCWASPGPAGHLNESSPSATPSSTLPNRDSASLPALPAPASWVHSPIARGPCDSPAQLASIRMAARAERPIRRPRREQNPDQASRHLSA